MIIATAGHVDHGKTLLVKALTGIDTDTLSEEKRRGLSINLGFAYLPVQDQQSIGFIDVPGHDRFIKNALCGLAATDFVLLLVAADDGPMPQTREHLAIIDLLGICRGAIVITKIDCVSSYRVEEVTSKIRPLIDGTTMAKAPLFVVSSTTNTGVENLRFYLMDQAKSDRSSAAGKPKPDWVKNNFRLAVDRTFYASGAGLIATGTILSGKVKVGDGVKIPGTTMSLRVRGLRIQNGDATQGRQGQRCALNLSGPGLRKELIQRGSWVTAKPVSEPIDRFDAELQLLDTHFRESPGLNLRALSHWTPVHIHLAASTTTARVAVLEGRSIAVGQRRLVQIVLDHPICAVFGDRFIIRDQSAQYTLGGGRVIDIFPPRRGRAKSERLDWLRVINHRDDKQALAGLLEKRIDGVNLDQFAANRNLTEEAMDTVVGGMDIKVIETSRGRIGLNAKVWRKHRDTVIDAVDRRCKQPVGEGALSEPQLIRQVGMEREPEIVNAIIITLIKESLITRDSQGIRLTSHRISMQPKDQALWNELDHYLSKAGIKPLRINELSQLLNMDIKATMALIGRINRLGLVISVSPSLVASPDMIKKLAALIFQLIENSGNRTLSVSAFRDASGIGRNLSIEVLEFFDAKGITVRAGNQRKLMPSAGKAYAGLFSKIADDISTD